jgi:hypothetical protein
MGVPTDYAVLTWFAQLKLEGSLAIQSNSIMGQKPPL